MIQDYIGRERDKTISDPNSTHTQPGGANFEKKIAKKFKKSKNYIPALFLAKTG